MRYEARSMQDIADHFDRLANSFADQAAQAKTAQRKRELSAMSKAWGQAADFMEKVELK